MNSKKYWEYSLSSYLEDLAANANEEGKMKRNIIYVQINSKLFQKAKFIALTEKCELSQWIVRLLKEKIKEIEKTIEETES